MTVPEKFVSRWVRLKREVASAKTEIVAEAPQHLATVATKLESDLAQPGDGAAIDEVFDSGSLPSIETIAAETDIRAFLDGRVPSELTRLALRRAWASDPAIRDFIGIAENQGISMIRMQSPDSVRCGQAIICQVFWSRRSAMPTGSRKQWRHCRRLASKRSRPCWIASPPILTGVRAGH